MNNQVKSRRNFLLRFFSKSEELTEPSTSNSLTDTGKTKMLTPDGKLVEVASHMIDSKRGKKKTSNAEILKWMGVNKN
jgi:hypothetical protein